MKKRRLPTLTERNAACLLMLKKGDDWLIPEPLRSTGTAEEIVKAVDWHHEFPDALGGTTDPRNITPLRCADHDVETATRTVPMVAKSKRITAAHEAFRKKMLAKSGQGQPRDECRRFRSVMPGSKLSRFKKKMNGRTEYR